MGRRNLNRLRHLCPHSDTLWDSGEAQDEGVAKEGSGRVAKNGPSEAPREMAQQDPETAYSFTWSISTLPENSGWPSKTEAVNAPFVGR